MNLITGQVPIRDPLGLINGVITNPQWIKWLTEQLAPAIVAISELGLAPENLLIYRQAPGVAQAQAEAESAAIAASYRTATKPESFAPPFTPARAEQRSVEIPISFPRTFAPWVLADTHANRPKYPNGFFQVATLFEETDRLYQFRNSGTAWKFVGGTYIAALASRPSDLSADDAGAEFYATDKKLLYYWDGAAWQVLGPPPLASGQIWVGDAGGVASAVTPSGDATISNTGALTLKNTGPGAGTHVVGLKLTGGGTDGSITIDAQGRVTAITDAT